ncbi:zinc-binding alcohol dehydrogenase family protein [Oecophyllibacter saccharovorans]|uniref:zinc-binding alcohol dehydrogenase family protein n=1 Tax=Oecophyllibacter saccharovorans TaxID=2558360 RepID=UPI00116E45C4|nr:zinc-binding alcohol dehydrogenase family protein [Oecophyllibacter saccharovorans]TPW35296.1 zinc-binding alcohol dehydrogenase family protein [Oecophyllibacter saccharovorans]
MHAVGFRKAGPISAPDSLIDFETSVPEPGPHDLLVQIKAISVNPADAKVRANAMPPEGQTRIPGWDAAGIVVKAGSETSLFRPGDEVYFAGDISRPGTYADYTLVDERITGHKPKSLTWAQGASIPLTALTAWEGLFDRLKIAPKPSGASTPQPSEHPEALLVIGGAGGVGSIIIQLARALTDLTVIATASRPETAQWATRMGAQHVIDHHASLVDQLSCLSVPAPRYVYSTNQTDKHLEAIAELIAPEGSLVLIDDPATLNVVPFKRKSVGIHWEFMFTRPLFHTADMRDQGRILNRVSEMLDNHELKPTDHLHMEGVTAENLRQAQEILESGKAIGKIVLTNS